MYNELIKSALDRELIPRGFKVSWSYGTSDDRFVIYFDGSHIYCFRPKYNKTESFEQIYQLLQYLNKEIPTNAE